MNRFWLGVLLAIGAAATGAALWWLREPPAPPAIDSRADYRLEGFEMTALRKDGSEGFTVVGPLLERDQDAQVTTITEPRSGFPARPRGSAGTPARPPRGSAPTTTKCGWKAAWRCWRPGRPTAPRRGSAPTTSACSLNRSACAPTPR